MKAGDGGMIGALPKERLMRKLALFVWLFVWLVPAAALANPDTLDGRWRLVAFKDGAERTDFPAGTTVVLVFDKAEMLWTAVVHHEGKDHRVSGAWQMDRNVLTMRYKGQTTELLTTQTGNTLVLAQKNNPNRRFIALRAAPK
jgi:hypothetical protein